MGTYANIVRDLSDSFPTFCFEPEVETPLTVDEAIVDNVVPTSESSDLLSVPEAHSKKKKRRHRSKSRNRDQPEKPTQVYEIIEPDFSDVGSDHQDSADEIEPDEDKEKLFLERGEVDTAIVSEAPIEELSKTKKRRQKKKGKKVKQDSLDEPMDVKENTELAETTEPEHDVMGTCEPVTHVPETVELAPEVEETAETIPEVVECSKQVPEDIQAAEPVLETTE